MRGLISLIRFSRSQWRSADELSRHRDQALTRLIRHAYERVPYYHSLFKKSGVNPDDIKTASDLTRIPVTRRKDLQGLSPVDLTARGMNRRGWTTVWTSGATATPLGIVLDPADLARFSAAFLGVYRLWGIRPADRLLIFESRPLRLQQRSWYERFGLFRRLRVSTLEPVERWIEAVKLWRPRLVQGHAPTLKLLAEAVQTSGADLRVPLVINTGATLDPAGRLLIKKTLGARVADVYASTEGGVIAWECPACGEHHVNEDNVIIEMLEDGMPVPDGEAGGVAVTVLGNYAMPIIRYEHGDIAVLSTERPVCGRNLRRMGGVLGRANDFIMLRSGRRLSPHPFYALMDMAVGVGAWQLTQRADHSLHLTVTASGPAREVIERELLSGFSCIVEDALDIHIQWTDRIERDPRQKMRSIISQVPGGGQGTPVIPFLQP